MCPDSENLNSVRALRDKIIQNNTDLKKLHAKIPLQSQESFSSLFL